MYFKDLYQHTITIMSLMSIYIHVTPRKAVIELGPTHHPSFLTFFLSSFISSFPILTVLTIPSLSSSSNSLPHSHPHHLQLYLLDEYVSSLESVPIARPELSPLVTREFTRFRTSTFTRKPSNQTSLSAR